ncbi:hypothetical protein GCHA_1521 [Paraglaciecola chathamensis S18K6]|uniref:Uncharacterized protein n=2 Tax=Paraglaciecola chathamensis TaxID=368405 RepID=A0ABQ0ICI1_9ALTE|nr:hypothetical protein GAGA_4156 [Paraglaciecola agarilytica NO2]GAC09475.1 hypothetical protein GCHA_1521 [Paraglaciecola chathamensis S18K6]
MIQSRIHFLNNIRFARRSIEAKKTCNTAHTVNSLLFLFNKQKLPKN